MYSKQQLTPNQEQRQALVWQMQYVPAAAAARTSGSQRRTHVDAVDPKWTGLVDSPQGPFNSLSKLSLSEVHKKLSPSAGGDDG